MLTEAVTVVFGFLLWVPALDHREASWMLLSMATLKTKADHGMKECVWPVGGMKDIIRVLE